MSGKSEHLYKNSKLQIIFAITLMGVMAVSLLSPAFPSIRNHFGVSKGEIGLLITVFTLPGILISFFIGALADKFGRLQILVPSLFLFGGAGGACAFSPNFSILLVLRFIQGLGGVGLVNLATTLIGDYYEGVERAGAMGLNASVLSLGTASYPFLGGILAEYSWSAPFFLYLLAIPVGIIALFFLDNPELRENPSENYMNQIKNIITRPRSLGGITASILSFVMLYGGVLTFFSQLASDEFGASASIIGILVGSMSISVALVSSQTGKLVKRFSKSFLIPIGFLFYGVGLLLIPLTPKIWMFFGAMAFFGLGHGLVVPNIQTLFSELAPRAYRGATMSIYNISVRTGQTLGPIILALVFAIQGFSLVFFTAGLISVITGITGLFLKQQRKNS